MIEVKWHYLLFLDFIHWPNFLKKYDVQKSTPSPFSGKEAPNLVDLFDQAILSMGTLQTVHLLR